MRNRTELTERAAALDPSIQKEDILLPIDYNLTPTALHKHTDGIAVLLKDRFAVFFEKIGVFIKVFQAVLFKRKKLAKLGQIVDFLAPYKSRRKSLIRKIRGGKG